MKKDGDFCAVLFAWRGVRSLVVEILVIIRKERVTGVYQNMTSGGICIMFRGEYASGHFQTAEGETSEAAFVRVRPYDLIRRLEG